MNTENEFMDEFYFNGIKVRTTILDEEPWFCLSDVCKILELDNPRQIKTRLKAPGVHNMDVGVQTGFKVNGEPAMQNVKMTFINESNLYKTIFQSRKPQAEEFTEWVTSEVLPSIRKTGRYQVDVKPPVALQESIIVSSLKVIDYVNNQILSGVEVSKELLKYAINMSHTIALPAIKVVAGHCLEDIISCLNSFPPGMYHRREVYNLYGGELSAKRFWGYARQVRPFNEVRRSNGIHIIIN